MNEKPMKREAVVQNLKDAGCPDDFVERFLKIMERGRPVEQLQLLACQRCRLLEQVHNEQKKLDCLDFLRYSIQKQAPKTSAFNRKP